MFTYSKILSEIDQAKDFPPDNPFIVQQVVEKVRNLSEFLVYSEKYKENYFE